MTFLIIIARAAGFCGVLGIIILSLVPGVDRPHTGLPGEVEHFIAYGLTASALALGFRPLAFRVVLAIGLSLLAGSNSPPLPPRSAVPSVNRPGRCNKAVAKPSENDLRSERSSDIRTKVCFIAVQVFHVKTAGPRRLS
jgi:hypothetical protein